MRTMSTKKLPPNVIDSKDRIIKKISSENSRLRQQFKLLMDRVRQNETIWGHFNEIEDIVSVSEHVDVLANKLIGELTSRFGLENVTILLTTDFNGMNLTGDRPRVIDAEVEHVYGVDEGTLSSRLKNPGKPLLSNELSDDFKGFFFPREQSIFSAAVLPLNLWGRLLGTLNLGSVDGNRYSEGSDTSFLERLASKTAIGISNVISRDRLEKLSVTDSLTGLSNRRHMEEKALLEFERSRRYVTTCSFIMVDLDGFKGINDRYGHATGDRILEHFATILRSRTRVNDTCARFGGDEFCILLPQTDLNGAIATANKLLEEFRGSSFASAGQTIPLSASLGVADTGSTTCESWRDIVRKADENLYEAKKAGGGTVFPAPVPET